MSKPKDLIFEEEARTKLRKGVDQLADVVAVTLGPQGLNVGLQASWGAPKITNDGYSISQDIELKDTFVNMGISLGKEVGSKMKELCGDGTTSSILLLRALVQAGVKNIASGSSPIGLKRGMDKAVEEIVKAIEAGAITIQEEKEILNIAIASASGNTAIGALIAEAIQKVGKSGVITIEEGKGTETSIETVEGMQFDRGYVSTYFCTNADALTVEMQNPRLLLIDKKLSSAQEILPFLQAAASTQTELLIIAEDFEGDVLSTLVVNRIRGTLKVCAVKSPGFGDRRKAMLEDLAVLTGATVISEETGTSLKDSDASVLGCCEKVVITKDKTTLVNGKGSPEKIRARVKQIEAEIQKTTSTYDKEKLEERKAKLSGGVAVIRVGAATEPEMKQKKQMFEDSLNSTRAAIEEGVVVGGGVALLHAAKRASTLNLSGDEAIGAQIVFKACEAPFRQIVMNTGFDPSVIQEQVITAQSPNGFNALSEKVENLVEAGVMDPAKVVKNALKFAASTAGIILLSEVLISDAPEEEEKA